MFQDFTKTDREKETKFTKSTDAGSKKSETESHKPASKQNWPGEEEDSVKVHNLVKWDTVEPWLLRHAWEHAKNNILIIESPDKEIICRVIDLE